jgi:hypothetical protein
MRSVWHLYDKAKLYMTVNQVKWGKQIQNRKNFQTELHPSVFITVLNKKPKQNKEM